MTTAAAPFFWPKIARATRAQVPRLVTTIMPAVPSYSAGSQPSEIPPVAVLSTLTVNGPVGTAAPLASIAVMAGRSMVAAGKVGVGSLAATDIAPSALAGEPWMYWFVPLLPAEATTMTPAAAALVAAAADGSSFEPNGEPSDMLITSMSLSTAHSIA